jgi:hypothetical protein
VYFDYFCPSGLGSCIWGGHGAQTNGWQGEHSPGRIMCLNNFFHKNKPTPAPIAPVIDNGIEDLVTLDILPKNFYQKSILMK